MFLKDILSKPVINITNGILEGMVINAVFDDGLRLVDKLVVFGGYTGTAGYIRTSDITLVTADSLVTETCAVTADEVFPAIAIDAEVYTKGGKRMGKVADIELDKFDVIRILLDTGRAITPKEIFCRGDIIILNEGSIDSDGGCIMNDEEKKSLDEALPKIARSKPRIAKEKAAGKAPGQSKPRKKAQNAEIKPASPEALINETDMSLTEITPAQDPVLENNEAAVERLEQEAQQIPQYTGTPIFEYIEEFAQASRIEEMLMQPGSDGSIVEEVKEALTGEEQNTEFLRKYEKTSYIGVEEFDIRPIPETVQVPGGNDNIVEEEIEAPPAEEQNNEPFPVNEEPVSDEHEVPAEETPAQDSVNEPVNSGEDVIEKQEEEEVVLPDPIAVGRSVYMEIDKPKKRRAQSKWKFSPDGDEGGQEDEVSFQDPAAETAEELTAKITVPDDFAAFMPATNMADDDEPIKLSRITINTNSAKKKRDVYEEADTAHIPDRILADFTFLLGRITTGPIKDSAGRVVIHKNELVTSDTVLLASKRGVLVQLTKYSLS